jgi:hypothetical protein
MFVSTSGSGLRSIGRGSEDEIGYQAVRIHRNCVDRWRLGKIA